MENGGISKMKIVGVETRRMVFFVRSQFRFNESDDSHFLFHAFNAKFFDSYQFTVLIISVSFYKMRLIMDFGMASQS